MDLQEALRLALLDRTRDAGHGTLADKRLDAGLADLRLAHADAAEGRIGIESVDRDAVGVLAAGVAKQVVGDDLIVVVAGVSEGALAVAVAERPDAWVSGAQGFIDLDVATLVGLDSGELQAELVGVGYTADRKQDVAAASVLVALLAVEIER